MRRSGSRFDGRRHTGRCGATLAGLRTLTIAVFAGLLLLSACGKKGPPEPPGPADKITWPRSYPTH